ncbi:MAG: hypothetical protein WC964_00040 [Acholeplasmataceae bacterium]
MKLNAKVYRGLTNEPFKVHEINGKFVEFHYMNDTPYFYQYANRGNFSVWTSDGNDYKVLVERDYHEALNKFYEPKVNEIWMTFLQEVGAIQRKVRLFYLIPMILVYVAIIVVVQTLFPEQILIGLLLLVVAMFGSNMIQSRYVTKKIREKNIIAQEAIENYLGVPELERIVNARDEHYRRFFEVPEEEMAENQEEVDTAEDTMEEIEVIDQDDSE